MTSEELFKLAKQFQGPNYPPEYQESAALFAVAVALLEGCNTIAVALNSVADAARE